MQGEQTGSARCRSRWQHRARFVIPLLLTLATVAIPSRSHGQSFMQQFMPYMALDNPQALGMSPEALPPDLDEPEIGEDAETGPFAEDAAASVSIRKTQPEKPSPSKPQTRHVAGQSHDPAPPLPLAARLRRVVRDSPLGGGMDLWFTRRPVRDVYFIAYDASAHERYLSFGSKHAVRGDFSAPGWRFISTLGIKIAAYDPPVVGRVSSVDLMRMMPGYEARFGRLTVSGYAGLGYARSQARGILATGRYGRLGAAALGEFWYSWSQNAPLMARFTSGYVVADSANRSVSTGLRHGVGLPNLPFLFGPEASWSAGRDVRSTGAALHTAFRKARLGGHASEIPVLAARLRISVGAQWQDKRKPGAYAELAAYLAY